MPSITFKCDDSLRDALVYQADKEKRSLSSLIRAELSHVELLKKAGQNLPPQRPRKTKNA